MVRIFNDFLAIGFIGFAPQIYDMVDSSGISDADDDQLFYTKIYIDQDMRVIQLKLLNKINNLLLQEKLGIKLDRKAHIFQNLNGAVGDVEIRFSEDDAYVQNTAFQTKPLVIHGNGPSKVGICCEWPQSPVNPFPLFLDHFELLG